MTDAVKRTLRNFGNLLGNCLYDKAYTQEVVKIKIPPVRFNFIDWSYAFHPSVHSLHLYPFHLVLTSESVQRGAIVPAFVVYSSRHVLTLLCL